MKVEGPKGPRPPEKSEALRKPRGAEAAAATSPATAISFVGVPEAELTPRVRAALTALMQEVADLRRELADVRQRMASLEELASTDPLIGILNRRAFVAELSRALAMAERYSQKSSLIFADLDNLKTINDTRGHGAGDAAIAHAAAVIGANIRQTDVFGRLGGDEFAIILTNTPLDLAAQKAKFLSDIVRSTPGPGELRVGLTCGVIEIAPGLTVESALEAADRVMYEEKRKR